MAGMRLVVDVKVISRMRLDIACGLQSCETLSEASPWKQGLGFLHPHPYPYNLFSGSGAAVQKAEQFLKTARLGGGIAGGAFDFISVCPPYLLVDYNELYDLLEVSPLVRCKHIWRPSSQNLLFTFVQSCAIRQCSSQFIVML